MELVKIKDQNYLDKIKSLKEYLENPKANIKHLKRIYDFRIELNQMLDSLKFMIDPNFVFPKDIFLFYEETENYLEFNYISYFGNYIDKNNFNMTYLVNTNVVIPYDLESFHFIRKTIDFEYYIDFMGNISHDESIDIHEYYRDYTNHELSILPDNDYATRIVDEINSRILKKRCK